MGRGRDSAAGSMSGATPPHDKFLPKPIRRDSQEESVLRPQDDRPPLSEVRSDEGADASKSGTPDRTSSATLNLPLNACDLASGWIPPARSV